MYLALEIRLPDLRIVGRIESVDGKSKVSFAEDELIRDSLERIIQNGIETILFKGKATIVVNTHPCDPDFLPRVAQYLTLSFNYLCFLKETDLKPQQIAEQVGESNDVFKETVLEDEKWDRSWVLLSVDRTETIASNESPFSWAIHA